MIQLGEHQVGFDAVRLGFPSIKGCMAIVYVTPNGLFGYHNYGGSGSDKWQVRATAFARFVNGHASAAAGTRLYGATFVKNHRGYGGDAHARWKAELRTFAHALGFGGGLRGIDLDKAPFSPNGDVSAYVEFVKVEEKCRVYAKRWDESFIDHRDRQTRLAADPNFKIIKPSPDGAQLDDGVNGSYNNKVNSSAVTVLHSKRL